MQASSLVIQKIPFLQKYFLTVYLKIFADHLKYSFMMEPALMIFYSKAPWINKGLHSPAKCTSIKNSSHIGQHQTSCEEREERAEYGTRCSLQTSIQAGAMQLCCDQTQTVPTSFYYKYFNFYSHKNACRCFMFYLFCCTGIKQSGGGWSYCLCLGSVTPSQYPALGCVWRLQSVMICSTAGDCRGQINEPIENTNGSIYHLMNF